LHYFFRCYERKAEFTPVAAGAEKTVVTFIFPQTIYLSAHNSYYGQTKNLSHDWLLHLGTDYADRLWTHS
jgi:hypothetical protein